VKCVQIGSPVPDDHDGTRLELVGSDADELAFEIALFVHSFPAVMELIQRETLDRSRVAAGIHLQILADASLEVWWQGHDSLKKHVRVLPLRDVPDDKDQSLTKERELFARWLPIPKRRT
jgi:hypothetical protein